MSTKALTFAARELSIERRTDGTLVLSSPLELGKCDWRITDFLPSWAHSVPDRIFLAQRNANGNGTRSPMAKHGRRFRRSAKA
jgi:feruloyl-CoA synthase